VRMVLNAEGNKIGHLRSIAADASPLLRCTTKRCKMRIDGNPNDRTGPLLESVLKPIYAAYAALKAAWGCRTHQPLDLNLPERGSNWTRTEP